MSTSIEGVTSVKRITSVEESLQTKSVEGVTSVNVSRENHISQCQHRKSSFTVNTWCHVIQHQDRGSVGQGEHVESLSTHSNVSQCEHVESMSTHSNVSQGEHVESMSTHSTVSQCQHMESMSTHYNFSQCQHVELYQSKSTRNTSVTVSTRSCISQCQQSNVNTQSRQ